MQIEMIRAPRAWAPRSAAATAGETVPSVIALPPLTPGTSTVSAVDSGARSWSGTIRKPPRSGRTGPGPSPQVVTE
ncbi:hypothetical protein GCM10020358_64490 [Amorphoplanes nipponensis]